MKILAFYESKNANLFDIHIVKEKNTGFLFDNKSDQTFVALG